MIPFFNKRKEKTIDELIKEIKPLFHTTEGRKEVVNSILYSEHPLYLSEYTFAIKDRLFYEVYQFSEERNDFLKNMIEEKSLSREKFHEYCKHINSANVSHLDSGVLFHTHPDSISRSKLKNKPDYSDKDLAFANKTPLGLIEYQVNELENYIYINSRLSLSYKGISKSFLELDIEFLPNKQCKTTSESLSFFDGIPFIMTISVPGESYKTILNNYDSKDNLINYVVKNTTKT